MISTLAPGTGRCSGVDVRRGLPVAVVTGRPVGDEPRVRALKRPGRGLPWVR
ncbi:hypothetical protein QWM81_04285 [Streptomyces ficellus]|uniref:Uncharacterized protein n=1 Tax=Streptomyces ficellus TaxID=1977088 RepID=A0ABT7Z1D2_9ACTN|nr:hypothetical protein [Streptomyces ficellus]MDN3293278.1 hypothetical protein [Streptomyces ficellus]